ncbi:MAG: MFS transporter [Opitutales bacterium]|nr:MFS transporter [Opitutales bacterium]
MFNYGWVVLFITVLLEGLSGFGRTASFSPFLKDVCRDLAVTSAQISFIYGLANLLTGIALPYIGRWYDRYPTKYFLRVFVTLFGSAFIGMSALKIIAAPPFLNLFILFCAFVAIRMSVQSYMLTGRCMVAAWFKENRGFATGLTCLLLASVASSMPHLNLRLSRFFAWQHVWLTVGIFWLCIMLFLVRWIKKPPAFGENDFDDSGKPKMRKICM